MSTHTHYLAFDAVNVPLQKSNLIEASAGTGKTYSIAIMVLRLVLQEKLPVKEILMVTFTKAAVAELEARIRLFIRNAAKASQGDTIDDTLIAGLVQDAIVKEGAEEIQQRLKEAVLFLDETAVLTIHSFCQQALTEFAFETKQIFGAETMQDTSSLLTDQVNQFWRTKITTLPVALLNCLLNANLSRKPLASILKEHLNGKKYMAYEEGKVYDCDDAIYDSWMKELKELNQKEEDLRAGLELYTSSDMPELKQICETNKTAKRYASEHIGSPKLFLEFIEEKRLRKYTNKGIPEYVISCFPHYLFELDKCEEALNAYNAKARDIINHLYCVAIQQASKGILDFKLGNNLLTFDDMIVNLHRAVVQEGNEKLIAGLRKKFKVVFVDEFQDTDRLQYDIFQKAFGLNHVLFYIGDPKQSIYAWRKADIFTYFEARKAVDRIYEMNVNHRSSVAFIAAMNEFFKIDDPFHFKDEQSTIEYIKVDTPSKNKKGELIKNGQAAVPISISHLSSKPAICEAVAAQIIELLGSNSYSIQKNGKPGKITPSDIGILVRTNKEGANIKAQLSRYGIPAVTIGDAKVLDSDEAEYVWYLLQAMEEPVKATINRALLSSFTRFTTTDVINLNEEKAIELFKGYKKTWEEDGIYTALMNFVADYRVRKTLLQGNTENGERIITNLFQLIELVHKVQTHKALSPLELIGWLKRAIDGMETEGDEYEQRIESDEEVVKIVTIHKSKGLEYNIVLAPFLDFVTENSFTTCSYRHPQTGEYFAAEKTYLTEEQKSWLQKQDEQENRRLLYVAITRAVYKCFIYKNTSTKNNKSSLAPFIEGCKNADPLLIETKDALPIPEREQNSQAEASQDLAGGRVVDNFSLVQNNWRKISYSSLAAKEGLSLKNTDNQYRDTYDQFVFSQLTKGVNTGNMLHYIFENINFTDNSKWGRVLEDAINQFAHRQRELYFPMLQQLLQVVLHTALQIGDTVFTLAEVAFPQRLHEFEFDFTVPAFYPRALNHLSDDTMLVTVKDLSEAEGVINGKMDLFFECQGKYFILDWKSNFLGSSLNDYSAEKITVAMNENNYHLQYLLYTLAAKKYLESRLGEGFDYERDFGGVVYLFVRGMRNDKRTGIFSTKPSVAQLEKLYGMLTTKWPLPSMPGHSMEHFF
ncbi:exodeoxyribonuclease V subunit beta [Niastella yeongjuensis]|uniref:RecBCD enzyme subunit RecB n=1 Tax=Niastella yeongjuensis TaxID=354355 RepID=A0A1V9ESZ8_9BACT|nr:exodeoxyribonuclease V subunit beta [Niastella yeongjuensis]OQP49287.1 exodeoxyribonuclease V subunit beta [Niastella yeongjuensis]SEP43009.1 DNA helicase/exodeoxyribonuclease V, beta subunit [Niastella yeongjuensis]